MSEVRWKTPSGSFAHPFEVWSFCWDCHTNIPGTRPWWPLFQTELGPSFKGFKPQNRGQPNRFQVYILEIYPWFLSCFVLAVPITWKQYDKRQVTLICPPWPVVSGFSTPAGFWPSDSRISHRFAKNGHGVPKKTRFKPDVCGWLCFGFCTVVEMAKQKPIPSMYDICIYIYIYLDLVDFYGTSKCR